MFIGATEVQLAVWDLKEGGATYRQIRQAHPDVTSNGKIMTCLLRTALCLPWYPSHPGGKLSYLSKEDEVKLNRYLEEHSDENRCVRTFQVVDLAYTLKQLRTQKAIARLRALPNIGILPTKVETTFQPPARSWVNSFAERYGFTIKKATEVERARLESVHKELLQFECQCFDRTSW